MAKKSNEPSDLQLMLVKIGLFLLLVIAVVGLVLNTVKPGFTLIPKKAAVPEITPVPVPTVYEPEITPEPTPESYYPEHDFYSKPATPSVREVSPSAVRESTNSAEVNLGPSCVSCED